MMKKYIKMDIVTQALFESFIKCLLKSVKGKQYQCYPEALSCIRTGNEETHSVLRLYNPSFNEIFISSHYCFPGKSQLLHQVIDGRQQVPNIYNLIIDSIDNSLYKLLMFS